MSTPKPPKQPAHVWRPAFLDQLRQHGNISEAARQAGIDRKTAYNSKAKAPEFAEAWEEAVAESTDTLEAEARRRAVEGVEEPVYYRGAVVGHITKYSDGLLMFLLKGKRPDEFRDTAITHKGKVGHAHSGTVKREVVMTLVRAGAPPPDDEEGEDE